MTSPYDWARSISTGASRERIERALVDYGAMPVRFSQLGSLGGYRVQSRQQAIPYRPVIAAASRALFGLRGSSGGL